MAYGSQCYAVDSLEIDHTGCDTELKFALEVETLRKDLLTGFHNTGRSKEKATKATDAFIRKLESYPTEIKVEVARNANQFGRYLINVIPEVYVNSMLIDVNKKLKQLKLDSYRLNQIVEVINANLPAELAVEIADVALVPKDVLITKLNHQWARVRSKFDTVAPETLAEIKTTQDLDLRKEVLNHLEGIEGNDQATFRLAIAQAYSRYGEKELTEGPRRIGFYSAYEEHQARLRAINEMKKYGDFIEGADGKIYPADYYQKHEIEIYKASIEENRKRFQRAIESEVVHHYKKPAKWNGPPGTTMPFRAMHKGTLDFQLDSQRVFRRIQEMELEVIETAHQRGLPKEAALEWILTKWEAENGFSAGTAIEYSNLALNQTEFFNLLKSGRLFDDNPLTDTSRERNEHGRLTHRIQWHLLMREIKGNSKPFLEEGQEQPPLLVEFYKSLGDETILKHLDWTDTGAGKTVKGFRDGKLVEEAAPLNQWSQLFDSFATDFTSPTFLRRSSWLWNNLGYWQ